VLSVARSSCESGTPPDKRLHEQTSGELKLHCVGSFIRRCDASVAAIEVVPLPLRVVRLNHGAPDISHQPSFRRSRESDARCGWL
jgi:hypothetical protein